MLLTGVYMIRNKKNGKVYIGSAAKSLKLRLRVHLNYLRKGVHSNIYLQRAWNKYGERSFEFVVILRCPPERCLKEEQRYLDLHQSFKFSNGYNRRPVAENNLGVLVGKETRAKLSAAKKGVPHSNAHRKHIGESLRGKKKSSTHIASLQKAHKGKRLSEAHKAAISRGSKKAQASAAYRKRMSEACKGRIVSLETRRKISEANKGRVTSEYTRKRISETNTGNKYWLGRHHTEETKQKLRDVALNRARK